MDTPRADHLGSYGHRLDTSPTVDALAESGVRFADASVQWTKTWPSMASRLTGTYPTETGIRHAPRRPLPERNRTLAERLREAGYATAAVVSNANLGRRFGFDQGFDHFIESWMEEYRRLFGDREFLRNRPGLTKRLTTARRVVDDGLAWLDARETGKPFFLWLHFMELHGPYEPPEELAERFQGGHSSSLTRPSAMDALELDELDAGTREQLRALGYLEPEEGAEAEGGCGAGDGLPGTLARTIHEARRENVASGAARRRAQRAERRAKPGLPGGRCWRFAALGPEAAGDVLEGRPGRPQGEGREDPVLSAFAAGRS